MNLVREPDAVNPPVRFDEREVETEHGMRLLRHRRENAGNRICRSLTHRATSRLYPELGGEAPSVIEEFTNHFKTDLHVVHDEERFLKALAGITDPQEKRKRIGHAFIECFADEASRIKGPSSSRRERCIPT